MAVFLLTFFLIYGSAHAYAFSKARAAFGFGWGPSLAAIPVLAALCCGPLIVYYLGERELEGAARAASWIGYIWMGLLFFFTCTNLALDVANLIAKLSTAAFDKRPGPLLAYGRATFLTLAGLSVALGIYSFLEASRIRLEHVRVFTDKLPGTVPHLRVVQISDVHLGLMVRHREASAVAALVRDARPDLFVCTGDLVDARTDHLDGLSEVFQAVQPPLGKYAVTGNHEFYAGIGRSLDLLRRAGFTVLRGEAVIVANILRIAGVDDPAGEAFGPVPGRSEEEILGSEPSTLFTLLLKHRPFLSSETRKRIDLQLSGHTHKGQIFPFRLLVQISYPLLAGLYASGDGGALYVSRGTGTWGPRMRFLSPPEVTVLDIERRTTGK